MNHLKTETEKKRDQRVRSCRVQNKKEQMPKTLKEIRLERIQRAQRGEFIVEKETDQVMEAVELVEKEMREAIGSNKK